VHVVIPRRVIQPGIIRLISDADQRYQLTQRERIALAMLAQTEGLLATELADKLELEGSAGLRAWTGRLIELGLIEQSGRTKAARYFVPPRLLRVAGLDRRTTLTRVQPHRLRALIVEDLERFPNSSSSDIHRRVGPEIPARTFRRTLEGLVAEGEVTASGERRWRRYQARTPVGQTENGGR